MLTYAFDKRVVKIPRYNLSTTLINRQLALDSHMYFFLD